MEYLDPGSPGRILISRCGGLRTKSLRVVMMMLIGFGTSSHSSTFNVPTSTDFGSALRFSHICTYIFHLRPALGG